MNEIYNNQKHTFKITLQFEYLLIKELSVDSKTVKSIVSFQLHYASTNTRLKGFEHPAVVDNKKDIERILNEIASADLIEQFVNKRQSSEWKFYKFLRVEFHVY